MSDEEIISMANSNTDEPERDNGLEGTYKDDVIASETTLEEAIEASSTVKNKRQVFCMQEKLINYNYVLGKQHNMTFFKNLYYFFT